jgi:hypothetical protein
MNGIKRKIALAVALLTSIASAPSVHAQVDNYPSREVKIICAFPAGSGADIWVRFFAEQARPLLKQPVLVENRVGASGLMATTAAARAKPDGYTLFMHSPTSLAANYFMFKDKPIDPSKEMITTASLFKFTFYLTVAANKPWKDVKELIADLRHKGDKASYATTAPPGQLMGSLFKEILKLQALEVPYRTGPEALNDYLSGAIDYGFQDGVFALAQQRAGNLRVLGIGSRDRLTSHPDIPTLHEMGVEGLDVPGFFGILAPTGTPQHIIEKLNVVFREVVATPQAQEFIIRSGGEPLSLSSTDAQKRFIDSFEEWGRLIKIAKIEPKG